MHIQMHWRRLLLVGLPVSAICPSVESHHRTFVQGFRDSTSMPCDPRTWEFWIEMISEKCYPDLADVPGKRVMVKTDCGPGRLDQALLVRWAKKGVRV